MKQRNKKDEESSPLPDVDRDTEQAVQDNTIWVFDIETDQSCEQNNNHKAVLLCAKTLCGDQELVFKGYDCVSQFCSYFLVIWNV